MPIGYMERTARRYAQYLPYRWALNHDAPWTSLTKPLGECRIVLLTSGGFYLPGQPPFHDGDASYRLIPREADVQALRVYHHAYRDDDVDRDPNCVFPLERFREFEAAGVIGRLADSAISFLTLYSSRREVEERAPRIVAELAALGAEAAFLVPV